jgi:hypothetical protein
MTASKTTIKILVLMTCIGALPMPRPISISGGGVAAAAHQDVGTFPSIATQGTFSMQKAF